MLKRAGVWVRTRGPPVAGSAAEQDRCARSGHQARDLHGGLEGVRGTEPRVAREPEARGAQLQRGAVPGRWVIGLIQQLGSPAGPVDAPAPLGTPGRSAPGGPPGSTTSSPDQGPGPWAARGRSCSTSRTRTWSPPATSSRSSSPRRCCPGWRSSCCARTARGRLAVPHRLRAGLRRDERDERRRHPVSSSCSACRPSSGTHGSVCAPRLGPSWPPPHAGRCSPGCCPPTGSSRPWPHSAPADTSRSSASPWRHRGTVLLRRGGPGLGLWPLYGRRRRRTLAAGFRLLPDQPCGRGRELPAPDRAGRLGPGGPGLRPGVWPCSSSSRPQC